MENRYDGVYPLGADDSIRVCSYNRDFWSKDGKRVRHDVCGRRFQQWNQQANREPFALCLEHAPANDGEFKKKKRQRS